ncbi:MAG TPA: hypothetical protein VNZ86_01170, partial [Bacteroidia bacterium]|nr:hypothetical protein [Bacteroidia bacterium]
MLKSILVLLALAALFTCAFAQDYPGTALSHPIITPASFQDSNVTFAIDTPSVTYKPYKGQGISLQNSSTGYKIFAYAILHANTELHMSLTVDTAGVKVDTVEVPSTPLALNFTLTTTVKPAHTPVIFPAFVVVQLLTQFQGIYI